MSDRSDSVKRVYKVHRGIPEGAKRCSACREVKVFEEFYPGYSRKRGVVYNQCKTCSRPRGAFASAKRRAQRAGVPFEITLADVVSPERCPCCDVAMIRGTIAESMTSPSIDRIIPRLGYTKVNTVVVCKRCNTAKSNLAPRELYRVAEFFRRLIVERGLDAEPQ